MYRLAFISFKSVPLTTALILAMLRKLAANIIDYASLFAQYTKLILNYLPLFSLRHFESNRVQYRMFSKKHWNTKIDLIEMIFFRFYDWDYIQGDSKLLGIVRRLFTLFWKHKFVDFNNVRISKMCVCEKLAPFLNIWC